MSTIGLQIDVDYNGQAAFRQVQGDVDRVAQVMRTKGSTAASTLQKGLGRLIGPLGFGGAGKAADHFAGSVSRSVLPIKSLISAAAAYAAIRLGQTIFSQSESMRGLELAFEAAAGGVKEGAAEFEFARQQAERLGIDLDVAAGSYKGMVAASIASGKSLEFAREVFLGVAESGRAMALSNEDIKGTMLAVQQIISKGTVNAEELRQQLGERFPVAVGIMAKALGVSTAELSKMMEQGQVTSDALLPFARKLREEYGDKLAGAIALPSAELSRLGNDAKELATSIGEGGLSAAVKIVATSLRTLFDVAEKENLGDKVGGAVKLIAEQFDTFIRVHGPGIVKTLGGVAEVISKTLMPSVEFLSAMFRAAQGVFNTFVGAYMVGISKIVGALETIVSAAAKVAGWVGLDGVSAKLASVRDALGRTQNTVAELGHAGIRSGIDLLKGTDQGEDGQKDLTKTVKLTAAEVAKLGAGAVVMGGAVVKAGNDGKDSLDKTAQSAKTLAEQLQEAGKQAVTTVNNAFKELGLKTPEALKSAADKGVAAFKELTAAGTATKTQLVQAAEETKQRLVAAYGKVPPEVEPLFKDIADDGKKSAKTVEDAFDKAGKGMAKSMADAADKIEKNFGKIREAARKQEIDKIQENSLMNKKMAPIETAFADDLPGLQEQLQDAIRAKGDIWRVGAGIKGYYDFAHKESDKIIAEIQGRIDALKQQDAEQQAGRSDNDRVVTTTTSTGSGSTGSGGGSRSGGSQRGGGIGGLGTTTLPPSGGTGSLVLGKDGGRSTTINNPQFVVDIRGVDEQMINSRNLVQQLLPELRRAVAQGELENTSR